MERTVIVILAPINIYFIHWSVANDHIYTNAPLSRPISEVKRVRARLVRTWGTSLESRGVVGNFIFFFFLFFFFFFFFFFPVRYYTSQSMSFHHPSTKP